MAAYQILLLQMYRPGDGFSTGLEQPHVGGALCVFVHDRSFVHLYVSSPISMRHFSWSFQDWRAHVERLMRAGVVVLPGPASDGDQCLFRLCDPLRVLISLRGGARTVF